ncbi:hypothetical protein FS749_000458 [Ceratobasidium sp. UAMH 11750]|nr:hypothetical protein FS749_000458 [Ceratobasidium sp. UAMH 11750]
MPRNKVDPPSSSPAPIRESQPRQNSPTTTEHGTQPHHALYDTPPEGTQPIELTRSERSRAKSARGRDALEYQHRSKPAASKSKSAASQPKAAGVQSHPTTATRTAGSQRAKGPAKCRALRFDGESSSDEPGHTSGDESDKKPKPRKRHNSGSKAHSPPPRPPGRSGTIARASQAADQRIILEPDTARELGNLIGINISTTTPTALKDTLRTLSNPNSSQVGPSQRYPQVRGKAATALPSLNKKGTYHRERLLELAHPRPSELLDTDTRPAKRSRTETRGESADEEMLDPDADKPEPDSPGLPRIPSFHSSQPLPSTSSTQRAVVNAFASQPRATSGPDFRPTPVPQTKGFFTQFISRPRSPSPDSRPPSPEPRPPSPERRPPSLDPRPFSPDLSPGPRLPSLDSRPSSPEPPRADVKTRANPRPLDISPTPEPRHARPTLATCSTAPPASSRKPPPDPNSATESETESEPQLKPKPKRRHRQRSKKAPTRNESPEPVPQPSDQRQQPAGERDACNASSTRHRDSYRVLMRLNELLDGDVDPNDKEVDSLLRWAADLALQRQPGRHPSSRTQPGSSSLRTQPGTPPSHARPAPAPNHDRRRPARDARLSDHNSEGEADAGQETDVETTDADDASTFHSSQRTLTDYTVASRAIRLLLSTAIRKGVYQSPDTCGKWGRNAYRRVWKKSCPHISYRECPSDLLQTIIIQISNLRTEVKKRIRMVI